MVIIKDICKVCDNMNPYLYEHLTVFRAIVRHGHEELYKGVPAMMPEEIRLKGVVSFYIHDGNIYFEV